MRKAKEALSGLRERKKLQTREAIVASALDLFERKGYDATTIEEIAEAADVSPRTFFRYFDSKVEVVMPSEGNEDDDFVGALATRPLDEGPIEAVRQVVRQELGAMLAEDPTHLRQLRIMLGTSSLQAIARDHFNEHQAEMASEFATRLGLTDDALEPHIMAGAIGNAFWTVATRWVAENGEPERLFTMLDEALDLLAKGLE